MIDWLPSHDGETWKAFVRRAVPGQMYVGYVKKYGPKDFLAVTRRGLAFTAPSMHEAACWLVAAICPVPKSN